MENSFRLASASVSDRGLSQKRPVNEDSFVELRELGLFAVADGVGGAQAGDVASQMAMEILSEAFANRRENTDAEDVMRIAIESANQAIYQMALEIPQLSSMATTIAAVHVNDNIATVAHVGDSRVYRILPDGNISRETADHSVVEEEVRAGRLTPEQALVHPSRNVISRALGADSTVDVELKTIMVEPGTMFLVCSDGITRHISDGEIGELFDHEVEPDVLVQQMRELCYSRGAEDNLTAVVVRVTGAIARASDTTSAERHLDSETEETTIATSRSPFDSFAEVPANAEVQVSSVNDIGHGDSESAQESLDDESYLLTEREEISQQRTDLSITQPVPAGVSLPAKSSSPQPEEFPTSFQTYESERPSALAKVFSSLLFLVIGAALGAGGYYYSQQLTPTTAPVPILPEPKSSNIPLTAFEEGRREVDRDPSRYLAANAASPQDAEDHYLLGRAQLLTGKYVEATRQFALAKERLALVDPANARTLAAEIALGQSVASNATAAEFLSKEMVTGDPAVPNSNGATNPLNSNVPVR